jgi:hypothetical protein
MGTVQCMNNVQRAVWWVGGTLYSVQVLNLSQQEGGKPPICDSQVPT